MKKVVRYIRDFSIVVAGIAVTLYLNDWVANRNETKEMKGYLNAVKLELENNIEQIDRHIERLKKSVDYANYLNLHDKKSLNTDTIKSYNCAGGYYDASYFYYAKEAFEMFKISGNLRLMKDRYLFLALWSVYDSGLGGLKDAVENLTRIKMDEIIKERLSPKITTKDFIPMYDYYTRLPLESMVLQSFKNMRENILDKIDRIDVELNN